MVTSGKGFSRTTTEYKMMFKHFVQFIFLKAQNVLNSTNAFLYGLVGATNPTPMAINGGKYMLGKKFARKEALLVP